MHLQIGDDRALELQVRGKTEFQSPHTGRSLRQLEVWAVGKIVEESHEAILSALKGDVVKTLDDAGNVNGEWKPQIRSHSHSGNDRTYEFGLTEMEELQASRVLIGGLALTPYRYEERPNGEQGVLIEFRVQTTAEETEQLTDLKAGDIEWHEVVREGISSEPKTMRFGKTRWSQHGEYDKHELVLVERPPQGSKGEKPFDFPDFVGRAHIAFGRALQEALMETLVAKGLLSDDEVKNAQRTAESTYKRQLRALELEDDIDRWDE